MKDSIEKTVKVLAEKAEKSNSAIESQQYAQAVLNLTNALACLKNMEK